jgi:hypothetical protein
MGTKYEELQDLTSAYGKATIAFTTSVRELGHKIVDAYAETLGGPDQSVHAVPAVGDFNPGTMYRDECYSMHGQGLVYLEPIWMGVCTVIRNKGDVGSTWVRTVIEFRPSDRGIVALVGDKGRKVILAARADQDFTDISEALFADVREAFSEQLAEARGDHGRIGFMTV